MNASPQQLVYLWSRLNPAVRLSLFGIITITAPYLPFALCLFSWALSPSGKGWGLGVIMGDALGLVAGHWWCVASRFGGGTERRSVRILTSSLDAFRYFWTEIWKRERGSGGRNWLETPRILYVRTSERQRVYLVRGADPLLL